MVICVLFFVLSLIAGLAFAQEKGAAAAQEKSNHRQALHVASQASPSPNGSIGGRRCRPVFRGGCAGRTAPPATCRGP